LGVEGEFSGQAVKVFVSAKYWTIDSPISAGSKPTVLILYSIALQDAVGGLGPPPPPPAPDSEASERLPESESESEPAAAEPVGTTCEASMLTTR